MADLGRLSDEAERAVVAGVELGVPELAVRRLEQLLDVLVHRTPVEVERGKVLLVS